MDKSSLFYLHHKVIGLGLGVNTTIALAGIIEILHKKQMLEANLHSSLEDDISLLEQCFSVLNRFSAYISLSGIDVSSKELNIIYVLAKRDAKWDEDDDVSKFIYDLIDMQSERNRNFYFSDNRLTPAIVDWLCNGEKIKKAFIPFNNNFDALKEISLKSEDTIAVNNDTSKSIIEKLFTVLLDGKCTFFHNRYEDLYMHEDSFDIGYSCPPIRANVDSDCRFSENHVLNELYKKVKGRFACVVPLGFTFQGISFVKSFREKYINEGRLSAVIKLPSGYLASTSIYCVALLFDKEGTKNTEIKMIDLSDNRYKDESLSRWNRFVLNEDALNLFKASMANEKSSDYESVSIEKIKANDLSLDPGIYVMSADVKESLKKIASGSVRLDSIASFYRAQATKTEETGSTYLEVGAADINEFGFIENPGKELQLEDNSKCLKNKIEKGDILFSIKGSVGKVALVDRDVDNWLVNQSFVIIKIKDKAFTPEYVFRFLKGKAVKDYISINTTGSFIGAFPIDKLKSITLDIPKEEDLTAAKEKNDRQLSLLKQIQDINDELRSLES